MSDALKRESDFAVPCGSFDHVVLDGFRRAAGQGLLKTDPAGISRRPIEGQLGLRAQFSGEHFAKKRLDALGAAERDRVLVPPDPAAFNFNKARPEERIAVMDVAVDEDSEAEAIAVSVMVNVSPLAEGHVLLIPRCEEALAQALTPELLLVGLRLCGLSARPDFRVVFNSLGAFASVNHFHLHGVYLDLFGLVGGYPVEAADRRPLAGDPGQDVVCEALAEGAWYVRGLVCSAPVASANALARSAGNIISELQRRGVPHNLLLVPPTSAVGAVNDSRSGAETADQTPVSSGGRVEVYIFPRLPESKFDATRTGFNAAVSEIAGMLVMAGGDNFESVSEAAVSSAFEEGASLPSLEFEKLIQEVLPAEFVTIERTKLR